MRKSESEMLDIWRESGAGLEIAKLRIREARGEKISDLRQTLAASEDRRERPLRSKPMMYWDPMEEDILWAELKAECENKFKGEMNR